MKKFLFLIVFLPSIGFSQTKEEQITQIREWYKQVETNLKNCVTVPLTMFYDEDYVTGGSTDLEGYYDTINKAFIKIIEHTYYDWAEDITSYYFQNGVLFFVFAQGNNPGEMYTAEELGISEQELSEMGGEAKTLNFYEDRYYFQNRECIQHLSKRLEVAVEEEPKISEQKNEEETVDMKATLSLQHHGYKMFNEFLKQLKK